MRIEKRSLPKFLLLNVLTLGIYGFITLNKIGKEINALCAGDGEEPRFGYTGAVMLRAISTFLGILLGFILGLAGSRLAYFVYDIFFAFFGRVLPWDAFVFGPSRAAIVFISMTGLGILFSVVGGVVSGIYLNYWWYRQTSRLKLNAGRYGLVIKESGTDTFLFRTALDTALLPFTLILLVLSFLIPGIIIFLLAAAGGGAIVFACILAFLFTLPLMLFGTELTAGANYSFYFLFKNLNRFSDVVSGGAYPFDPMAYEYGASVENNYPNFLPNLNNGDLGVINNTYYKTEELGKKIDDLGKGNVKAGGNRDYVGETVAVSGTGSLEGLKGTCAGYKFELKHGEEIVIGKDAKVSSIVIDPAFKQVSRKHVGVSYDANINQYRVKDYSSNGTWANDQKLTPGQSTLLGRGTVLKLADDKNTFRLG